MFRRITPGIESFDSTFSLPRHRHLRAYATVVLAGTFEEAGYAGRIRATAGDVLIHPTLDCHANQKVSVGVKLIRLEWRDDSGLGGLYHLDEVDELARTAEKDVIEATLLLESVLRKRCLPSSGQRKDWPDLLLTDLANNDPHLERAGGVVVAIKRDPQARILRLIPQLDRCTAGAHQRHGLDRQPAAV